jgi:hypothetical protein
MRSSVKITGALPWPDLCDAFGVRPSGNRNEAKTNYFVEPAIEHGQATLMASGSTGTACDGRLTPSPSISWWLTLPGTLPKSEANLSSVG